MSMKSSASVLEFAFVGTTQMLPDEPGCSVFSGNSVCAQSNWISSCRRPNHHEPETMIG